MAQFLTDLDNVISSLLDCHKLIWFNNIGERLSRCLDVDLGHAYVDFLI